VKLTALDPSWVGAGGPGIFNADGTPAAERHGVGITFDCPCGCTRGRYVPFTNPLDGGPPHNDGHATWQRSGETFETLTLTPSIQVIGECGWHGFITNGEIVSA
jgi:hypothetical protein